MIVLDILSFILYIFGGAAILINMNNEENYDYENSLYKKNIQIENGLLLLFLFQ